MLWYRVFIWTTCIWGDTDYGRYPATPTRLPWPPWGTPTTPPHDQAHLHGAVLPVQAVL